MDMNGLICRHSVRGGWIIAGLIMARVPMGPCGMPCQPQAAADGNGGVVLLSTFLVLGQH